MWDIGRTPVEVKAVTITRGRGTVSFLDFIGWSALLQEGNIAVKTSVI